MKFVRRHLTMDFVRRHLRLVAFLVLAIVTVYGLSRMFSGDWRSALSFWRGKVPVLCLCVVLQGMDISFDSYLWSLILREFDVRYERRIGTLVFMSGYAGLFLPFQLGRFIRSEAIARLGLGEFGEAVKAEFVLLFLTAVSAAGVVAGAVTYAVFPWAVPVAVLGVIGAALFFADRAFALLARTPVNLPAGYWWRWRTFAIGCLTMVGWLVSGSLLYLVVHDLPGGIQYWQALFVAPANLVLGQATGLPGGVGAIEGFIGATLRLLEMPPTHLTLAVGAFRLVTFWIWLPIGWLAFTTVNRIVAKQCIQNAQALPIADSE